MLPLGRKASLTGLLLLGVRTLWMLEYPWSIALHNSRVGDHFFEKWRSDIHTCGDQAGNQKKSSLLDVVNSNYLLCVR